MSLKSDIEKRVVNSGLVKPYDVIAHSYTDGNDRPIEKMIMSTNGIFPTLTTRPDIMGVVVMDKVIRLGGLYGKDKTHQAGSIYDPKGLAPTIDVCGGGYRMQLITQLVRGGLLKRYKNYVSWKNNNGEFNTECNRASLEHDLSLTIPTSDITKVMLEESEMLRIRKLTPLECLKLMGFTEKDYQAMRDIGMSDAAIYHMAGDSICVPVLIGIFAPMFEKDHTKIIEDYVDEIR